MMTTMLIRAAIPDREGESGSSFSNMPEIPQTDYAPPYTSKYLKSILKNHPNYFDVLKHLNCYQLIPSTRDTPVRPGDGVSLRALQQHVQAVCLLIQLLEPSSHPKRPKKPPNVLRFFKSLETPLQETGDSSQRGEGNPLRLLNEISSEGLKPTDPSYLI